MRDKVEMVRIFVTERQSKHFCPCWTSPSVFNWLCTMHVLAYPRTNSTVKCGSLFYNSTCNCKPLAVVLRQHSYAASVS